MEKTSDRYGKDDRGGEPTIENDLELLGGVQVCQVHHKHSWDIDIDPLKLLSHGGRPIKLSHTRLSLRCIHFIIIKMGI